MGMRRSGQPGAYTLLELLVTVALVAILLTLIFPITDSIRKKAEKVKCMSHMRALHASLSAHLEDKGHWPQVPRNADNWDESRFYRFWVTSLEPYGSSRDTWLCPSDKLIFQVKKSELEKENRYFGSYVPTAFDDSPSSPLRWLQPWLVERGDFHGEGGHMLMPDGSISSTQNPFHSR